MGGKSMKTIVFVDGENLRHRLAKTLITHKRIQDTQQLKKFDLKGLVTAILPEEADCDIRYYGAKVRRVGLQQQTKRKILAIIQQKRAWNSELKQQGITYIEAGSLRLRQDGFPKSSEYLVEKGVDVSIAVDMILAVLRFKAERLVLLSSDADLLPVVRNLKDEQVSLTYVAHESFVLPSLAQFSSKTRTFTDQQVLQFYDSKNAGKIKK